MSFAQTNTNADRSAILNELEKFINQRSGIEWRDYYQTWADTEGVKCYRRECRTIQRDGREARILLEAVRRRDIPSEDIIAATSAFNGRLTWDEAKNRWQYIAYQMDALEYRPAACAVLALALWNYARAQGYKTSDQIKKWARDEFGRGIASRWFN